MPSRRRSTGETIRSCIFLDLGEDELPTLGLNYLCYYDVVCLANVSLAVLDDHHGAVLEESNTLAGLITLPDDINFHMLLGQHVRTERKREVVNVEHADILQGRDAIQVVIVGDQIAAERDCESDESCIDSIALVRGETIMNANFHFEL